jgi:3-oxoacyl-[acyl-carrier protein] reductase
MINIDLKNKTAIVTGASGELGRTMVRKLSAAGANVIIHYNNNSEKALALQKEIESEGNKAFCVQADITNKESIENMKKEISSSFQMPEIIVTNAVIQYEWTNVLNQSESDYESQFKSCVMQNVLMAKAFLPKLIEDKWGRFIAINTECTMQCHPSQSAYVSGKRGMDGMLRVLAKEIGENNITVNQVAPGWTMSENSTDPSLGHAQKIPLKRRGTDEEVANVIAFLASELSSYITGAYIPVCGGNVMPTV